MRTFGIAVVCVLLAFFGNVSICEAEMHSGTQEVKISSLTPTEPQLETALFFAIKAEAIRKFHLVRQEKYKQCKFQFEKFSSESKAASAKVMNKQGRFFKKIIITNLSTELIADRKKRHKTFFITRYPLQLEKMKMRCRRTHTWEPTGFCRGYFIRKVVRLTFDYSEEDLP